MRGATEEVYPKVREEVPTEATAEVILEMIDILKAMKVVQEANQEEDILKKEGADQEVLKEITFCSWNEERRNLRGF